MVARAIRFPTSTWKQAKRKAGLTPISAIVRRLVELWVSGKINLDDFEN